ncbi:MAG TPA: type II toxin-antitoxin system HipA family toxin [Opitutaceae bacterium]|nr:type II toxin-antitoxin system HipA family toxin [Opitutaceae bacterium]
MTEVPQLFVRWYDGRLVGTLVNPSATYFAYSEEWVRSGFSLSPIRVPFDVNVYRQSSEDFDRLPGFLSDCLPDQWGRQIMERAFAELDLAPTSLRRLAWVAQRGIGALQFEPAIPEAGTMGEEWKKVSSLRLAREAQAVLRHEPKEAFKHLRMNGSPGGALPKATVAVLPGGDMLVGGVVAGALRDHPGAILGILKLDQAESLRRSTDGRFEHAYMLMARAAGVRAANTWVMSERNGGRARHHLFVERFDVDSATGRRRHLVTLAGLLETYSLDYRRLLLTTRQLTQDHGEVLEAVRRMIFNVRSVIADDHGKNHSFVLDEIGGPPGKWTLSPAYDLTLNAEPSGEYNGLSAASFGKAPNLSALITTALDAGVQVSEFERLDSEVSAAVGRWSEFAEQARLSTAEAKNVQDVLTLRADLLQSTMPNRQRERRRRRLWEA